MLMFVDVGVVILISLSDCIFSQTDIGQEENPDNETAKNDWETFIPDDSTPTPFNAPTSSFLYDTISEIIDKKEIENTEISLLPRLFDYFFRNRRQFQFITLKHSEADVMLRGLQNGKQHVLNINSFSRREGTEVARSTALTFLIFAANMAEATLHINTIGKKLHGDEYGPDMFILMMPEISDNEIIETSKWAHQTYHWFNFVFLFMVKVTNQIFVSINMYNPLNNNNDSPSSVRKFLFNNETTQEEWKQPHKYLRRRVRNLEGAQFKVTMDNYSWFSIPVLDSDKKIKKFAGKEGEIVHLYSMKLNYTPIYKMPIDGTAYGGAMSNGTIIGGVKDVNDGNADLYGNGIIVSNIASELGVRFLRQLQQTQIVIIMPLPLMKIQHIQTILDAFEDFVIGIMFLVFGTIFTIWFLTRLLLNPNRKVKKNLIDIIGDTMLYIIGLLHSIPMKVPTHAMEKFLFFLLLYWALIMNSIYQGRIITGLTFREREQVSTLQEFEKYNYPIVCVPDLCKYLEPNEELKSEGPIRKKLYKRIQVLKVPKVQSHIIAKYRNFSKIVPHFTALANQLTFFDSHGNNMLHILNESLGYNYMSQVVPKWSPVSVSLNLAQIQIVTAGLNLYWGNYYVHKLRLKRYHTNDTDSTQNPITFEHLKPVFVIWMSGLGIGIILLFLEVIIKRIRRK